MVWKTTSECHIKVSWRQLVTGWACLVVPRRSAFTVYGARTSSSTMTGKSCSGRSLTWTPRPRFLPGSITTITVQAPNLLLPCSDCAES